MKEFLLFMNQTPYVLLHYFAEFSGCLVFTIKGSGSSELCLVLAAFGGGHPTINIHVWVTNLNKYFILLDEDTNLCVINCTRL